jgi:hypothetical protein
MAACLTLDADQLWAFPAGPAAGGAEVEPIVLPVPGHAGEQRGVGGDALGPADDDEISPIGRFGFAAEAEASEDGIGQSGVWPSHGILTVLAIA